MSCNNRKVMTNMDNSYQYGNYQQTAYTPQTNSATNPVTWNPPATTIPAQNTAQSQTIPATNVTSAISNPNTWTPETLTPETLTQPYYTPAFLLQNLGSLVRVEFLIGNNTTDRVGILSEVGASYIVLKSLEGDSRIMCDLYSIKFVTIISRDATSTLLNTYRGTSLASDASVLMSAAGRQ